MGDPNNPLPSINHFEAYNILKEHKFSVLSATRAIFDKCNIPNNKITQSRFNYNFKKIVNARKVAIIDLKKVYNFHPILRAGEISTESRRSPRHQRDIKSLEHFSQMKANLAKKLRLFCCI